MCLVSGTEELYVHKSLRVNHTVDDFTVPVANTVLLVVFC